MQNKLHLLSQRNGQGEVKIEGIVRRVGRSGHCGPNSLGRKPRSASN